MKYRKLKGISVSLAGGLGNQLFQLAAGMTHSGTLPTYLNFDFGSPRTNQHGEPEIMSFKLPDNVYLRKGVKADSLSSKLVNALLRSSLDLSFKAVLLTRALNPLVSFCLSIKLKKLVIAKTGRGVGFFSGFSPKPGDLLIGYFQSFVWASNQVVFEKLMQIEPVLHDSSYFHLVELAQKIRPVIVHVRLGDYRFEPKIGILDKDYYVAAIEEIFSNSDSKEIWVFSDEPWTALEMFSEFKNYKIRLITELQNSPAHTFQLMRHGSAFIIANSTFSWWAAFLRFDQSARVIAPEPWFSNAESPHMLIPHGWVKLARPNDKEDYRT